MYFPVRLAKTSYGLTILISMAAALFVTGYFGSRVYAVGAARGLDSFAVWILLAVILAFAIPGARAIIRKLRGRELLPSGNVDRLSAPVAFVLVFSVAGHLILAWIGASIYASTPNERTEISMIGLPLMTAGLLYLLVLWIGEFVLAGRPSERGR